MATKNGFEYVVAAMQLQVTKAKTKKSRKRTKRTPDGTVRSSTKLVLILLVNHRNNKTGQCNPSVQRLMDQTGYSKRTILFELQALKELGILEWQHGWGNAHAKQSNRYTVNLREIQNRHEESAVDESAVGEDESAVGTMKVHSTTDESAARAPLTSKEPPIIEHPRFEPSETLLVDVQNGTSEAGCGAHLQNEESAPDAPSYESASGAPSRFSDLTWEFDSYINRKVWGAPRGRRYTAEDKTEVKRRNDARLTPQQVEAELMVGAR